MINKKIKINKNEQLNFLKKIKSKDEDELVKLNGFMYILN